MPVDSNHTEPTVSVIIPCYGQAEFLSEAVSSALAQTYSAIEVIVVDDGSPDDVRSALVPFADRPNVRLHQQTNTGVSIARNNGAGLATGDYLQFLDADDVIDPRKIEMQMQQFRAYPDTGVVYCDYTYVFMDQNMTFAVSLEADELVDEQHFQSLWGRMVFPTCVPLVRRKHFEEVGGFNRDYPATDDLDLFLRIAAGGCTMKTVSMPLAFYRKHGGSITTGSTTSVWREFERLLRESLTRFQSQALDATPISFCKLNRQVQARTWFLAVARAELDAAKEQLRLQERALTRHHDEYARLADHYKQHQLAAEEHTAGLERAFAESRDEYARLADHYKQHQLAAEEHAAGLERAFAESRRYADALEEELRKVSGRPLNP